MWQQQSFPWVCISFLYFSIIFDFLCKHFAALIFPRSVLAKQKCMNYFSGGGENLIEGNWRREGERRERLVILTQAKFAPNV